MKLTRTFTLLLGTLAATGLLWAANTQAKQPKQEQEEATGARLAVQVSHDIIHDSWYDDGNVHRIAQPLYGVSRSIQGKHLTVEVEMNSGSCNILKFDFTQNADGIPSAYASGRWLSGIGIARGGQLVDLSGVVSLSSSRVLDNDELGLRFTVWGKRDTGQSVMFSGGIRLEPARAETSHAELLKKYGDLRGPQLAIAYADLLKTYRAEVEDLVQTGAGKNVSSVLPDGEHIGIWPPDGIPDDNDILIFRTASGAVECRRVGRAELHTLPSLPAMVWMKQQLGFPQWR